MKKLKKGLSIVVPAFNEENFIKKTVTKINSSLKKIKLRYEIYIVDDGSIDKTYQHAIKISKKDKKIKILRNKKNYGMGYSLKICSQKAKYNKKKLAISTSTSRDNVTLLLRSCLNENPEDVFSFISTGDLVEKKKPSPDLYKLVLAEMNVMPEECLAFEDSRIGLVSAKRANIKTAVNPSQ